MVPALTGLPPAGTKSTGRPMQNGEEAKNYDSFLGLFCASANSILQGSSFLSYPVFTRDAGNRVVHPRQQRPPRAPAGESAGKGGKSARLPSQPGPARPPARTQYGATRASDVLARLQAGLPPRRAANRTIEVMQRSRRFLLFLLPALFCSVLGASAQTASQEATRRLILKDGSYQLVTKYEVKGDRVRYYSSEREEWEELPNSLVDWTTTNKYEKERASAPEAVQLDKEIEHDNELAEASLPQVAPGLRIPEDQGVFLLDNFQGEPQLLEIQQNASDISAERKTNVLRNAVNPIAGLKQSIELDHSHAAMQAHVEVPSLYINVDTGPDLPPQPQAAPKSDQSQQAAASDRYRILRLDVKRQVSGKITQQQHEIKSTATHLSGGWLKLTPTEALAPGEYAVVEMMGKEGMNLYVWDFGVNAKAPANPNPWKPEVKSPSPASPPDQSH